MNPTQTKKRVIREVVKDQHTAHWDQDMLSWSELEALMLAAKPQVASQPDSAEIHVEARDTAARTSKP